MKIPAASSIFITAVLVLGVVIFFFHYQTHLKHEEELHQEAQYLIDTICYDTVKISKSGLSTECHSARHKNNENSHHAALVALLTPYGVQGWALTEVVFFGVFILIISIVACGMKALEDRVKNGISILPETTTDKMKKH